MATDFPVELDERGYMLDFEAWTESEAFRKAHAQARAPEGTYLGPPKFEGFEVISE